ncbi:hypothetical protein L7F22_033392 [Adiantum nelumboides]|nr:hypothetical protein [Adiantum nelumboides]
MGLSDRQSCSKPWKLSITAKAEGLVTAEMQIASPGTSEKKGFLQSFLAKIKRRSSMQRQEEEGATCDASLRVRARLFFLRARIAAGRLHELYLKSQQGTLLHYRSSGKAFLPAPASFKLLKGSTSCSPSSKQAPSFLSRVLSSKEKRKGSLLVCGAGVGAFALFLLHHAGSWATHFPTFALNAGSRLVGLFAKLVHRKCYSAGFKGAACFWQGIRGVVSLFQMVMSVVRPIFAVNQFANTALLAVLIAVLLTGRANKLQDFLDSKTRGRAGFLKGSLAMKLLLVMQLIKRFWAHISLRQACLFALLLTFLTSAVSEMD